MKRKARKRPAKRKPSKEALRYMQLVRLVSGLQGLVHGLGRREQDRERRDQLDREYVDEMRRLRKQNRRFRELIERLPLSPVQEALLKRAIETTANEADDDLTPEDFPLAISAAPAR